MASKAPLLPSSLNDGPVCLQTFRSMLSQCRQEKPRGAPAKHSTEIHFQPWLQGRRCDVITLISVSTVTFLEAKPKSTCLYRLLCMSFGCEVGVRKNRDRTTVLRHIPPNPHTIPQPDRRQRRNRHRGVYLRQRRRPAKQKKAQQ